MGRDPEAEAERDDGDAEARPRRRSTKRRATSRFSSWTLSVVVSITSSAIAFRSASARRSAAIPSGTDPAVARERVAAARLGVAADERVVRGVEEEDLDVVPLLPHLLDDARRVGEEPPLARVDHERDARDLAGGVPGQLEELLEEEDGEVVDAVEPGVLERAQRGRLPRPGHAGEDDDLRTAGDRGGCGITRRPSRRRARPARARWRG